jgi:hypothetical protein
MKIAVLYVGSSLLAPLRRAERDINNQYRLGLRVTTHNCTLPLSDSQWIQAEQDLAEAAVVFVIHVTDQENASRIAAALDRLRDHHHAVIVIYSPRKRITWGTAWHERWRPGSASTPSVRTITVAGTEGRKGT